MRNKVTNMKVAYGPKGKPTPTLTQYSAFQAAWDYFNTELWGGRLAPCILVFNRRKNARGFFAPAAWSGEKGVTHEISLNPRLLKSRELRDTFSTLVHEMAHQWQHDFGQPSRSGYHNEEWAAEMDRIGLTPTNTGEKGGRRTGHSMTHLIVDGGLYDQAFQKMPDHVRLPWLSGGEQAGPEKKKSTNKEKVKYGCGCTNVWGKAGIRNLWCMNCNRKVTGEGSGLWCSDWSWEQRAKALVLAFADFGCRRVFSDPDFPDSCWIQADELMVGTHGNQWVFKSWIEAFLSLAEWMPSEIKKPFNFSGVEIPVQVVCLPAAALAPEQKLLE